jgi:hypothetical protein
MNGQDIKSAASIAPRVYNSLVDFAVKAEFLPIPALTAVQEAITLTGVEEKDNPELLDFFAAAHKYLETLK